MNTKMRLLIILFFATCVFAKINMKALTESMGQEVIEIGAPIRELPPDIEEEPSAENDGDTTTTDIKVATPKEKLIKKSDPTKKTKDVDKIDGKKQQDEEARIEKELADIYKDSVDYKSDSSEVTNEDNSTEISEKPVARIRTNFQFQPDSNSPEDVARFRTSIDDINCGRTKLSFSKTGSPNGKTIDKEDLAEDKGSFGYVSESANDLKVGNATELEEHSAARVMKLKRTTRRNYWFGPHNTNQKGLEKFRTSQDYLNCDVIMKLSNKDAVPKVSGSQDLFKDTAYFVMIHLLFYVMYFVCLCL